MALKPITEPTAEPISIEDARLHLRLDTDGNSPPAHPDDVLIGWLIQAGRELAEQYTGRTIAHRTMEQALDQFPCSGEIQIETAPVRSITSVTYRDSNGDAQVLTDADYVLDDYKVDQVWLLPAEDTSWPVTRSVINAVKIRFEAGYDLPEEVVPAQALPASIKAAILLMLGHYYENREDVVVGKTVVELPMGSKHLLNPWRLNVGFA
jgi:uncharacterized phiE125 gp8 family phage protein